MQIGDVILRKATASDAAEIANVHVNAWREAYRGLLPQDFLDQLPLSFKRRMSWWAQAASAPGKYGLFVAEAKGVVVGFVSVETARELPAMEGFGEVTAIYLFEKYKGQGIGAGLLKLGLCDLQARGFSKAYCWVLEGNPTIAFYEKSGAHLNGVEKPEEIGGRKVKELCYVWSDISALTK